MVAFEVFAPVVALFAPLGGSLKLRARCEPARPFEPQAGFAAVGLGAVPAALDIGQDGGFGAGGAVHAANGGAQVQIIVFVVVPIAFAVNIDGGAQRIAAFEIPVARGAGLIGNALRTLGLGQRPYAVAVPYLAAAGGVVDVVVAGVVHAAVNRPAAALVDGFDVLVAQAADIVRQLRLAAQADKLVARRFALAVFKQRLRQRQPHNRHLRLARKRFAVEPHRFAVAAVGTRHHRAGQNQQQLGIGAAAVLLRQLQINRQQYLHRFHIVKQHRRKQRPLQKFRLLEQLFGADIERIAALRRRLRRACGRLVGIGRLRHIEAGFRLVGFDNIIGQKRRRQQHQAAQQKGWAFHIRSIVIG